ncbi:PEP-CTERM sorting domain-containing protein [Coleofasciculus sp. F4-SAH-05]|uniref:PEP-CTERM sorting domain-containing protein n=1 Tax=Coleofasciculus sp. F4-SAH-05 TaxID=3069525 RepID=UPI0032FDA7DF
MNLAKTSTVLGLVAGSALALSAMPAEAASFGNGGILFDTDTKVDFEFLESHGKFQSTLFIVEATDKDTPVYTLFTENEAFISGAEDFKGLCPETVTAPGTDSCTNWFIFEKDVEYSLLLDSGNSGKVWSTNKLNNPSNPNEGEQAKFIFGQTDAGKYTILFDDRGNGDDKDFNDFTITADIPEPATLAGLGLIGGALALTRRRKAK